MIRLLFTEGAIPRQPMEPIADRVIHAARRDLAALDRISLFKTKVESGALRKRLVAIIRSKGGTV